MTEFNKISHSSLSLAVLSSTWNTREFTTIRAFIVIRVMLHIILVAMHLQTLNDKGETRLIINHGKFSREAKLSEITLGN